jgi:O-antigen ligase
MVRGRPSALVTGAFVAFVTSLPLEGSLFLGGQGFFSIARLLGYLLFGLAVLQAPVSFNRIPRAMWWFAVYVAFSALRGLFEPPAFYAAIASTVFRRCQLLLILWIGYNLFRDQRTTRRCLWGFSLSSLVVAGLLLVGVATTEMAGRESVFGENANIVGELLALGAVTLIGMVYGKTGAGRVAKLVVVGGVPIIAIAIAKTGSRVALVAMCAGLMMLVGSRGSVRVRIRNTVIVLLALAVSFWVTLSFGTAAQRWRSTFEEGNMSGRVTIYLAASEMVKEKPLFGWGPLTNQYELGYRLKLPRRDTHNLYLWLLTEAGLVGALPFFVGLGLCIRAGWRGRKSARGLLPLALLATILTVNLSGTHYDLKWFWIVLALALASESIAGVGAMRLPASGEDSRVLRGSAAWSQRRRSGTRGTDTPRAGRSELGNEAEL